jgi:hypothetical protein
VGVINRPRLKLALSTAAASRRRVTGLDDASPLASTYALRPREAGSGFFPEITGEGSIPGVDRQLRGCGIP